MHISFIPYGARLWVEQFLRNIEAQIFYMPMWKGKKKKKMPVFGAVRQLPLGVYEIILPKEYKDIVLTTLDFQNKNNYLLGDFKLNALRKMLGYKKAGEFDTSQKLLWMRQYVSIIPIGIKEDEDSTDRSGGSKGWTHEGL